MRIIIIDNNEWFAIIHVLIRKHIEIERAMCGCRQVE